MTATAASTPLPRGARRYRLTGTGAFDAVFQTGRRREGTYMQLVYAPARALPGRVGYVIGKKALPLAVDRNRVRRMLRPVVQAARPRIEALDLIVRLKKGCPRSTFPMLAQETKRLIALLPEVGEAR